MTRRTIVVDSEIWKVYPTGRITVYGKDEFGLLFELGTGPERKRRFTRYSPLGSKSTDASLAELTERQLLDFFRQSQPAWTSPRSEEHTSELQSLTNLVCRLLLEKKNKQQLNHRRSCPKRIPQCHIQL